MKQSDIIIGATYLTRIGQALAPVIVVALVRDSTRTRYNVRRVGSEITLPKPRSAAALHAVAPR